MSHSNSSLNCFASCMAKYQYSYILHTKPCKPISPHLTFGTMAHDVLHKAGILRDEIADKVVDNEQYKSIIPSDVLYQDLKTEFSIKSWPQYFMPIIKETAKYEQQCIQQLFESNSGSVQVEREIKLQLNAEQARKINNNYHINQPIVGIVDLLIYTKTHAIILDYKFSSNKKTQDDFDMNSQLPLYALLVHINYDIPLQNIQYGYIDIPKQEFGQPTLLTNGTLSRSKSQNVSQELYEQAVIAIHGDDEYYNCKPGGYYYDCYCNLALNKPAYLSIQYLDFNTYENVIEDIFDAADLIDYMTSHNLPFVKKYDAYSCKNCEYLRDCKKWLFVDFGE